MDTEYLRARILDLSKELESALDVVQASEQRLINVHSLQLPAYSAEVLLVHARFRAGDLTHKLIKLISEYETLVSQSARTTPPERSARGCENLVAVVATIGTALL